MRVNHKMPLVVGALLAAGLPSAALAQDDAVSLAGLSGSQLRGEVERRYDEALRLTLDPAVISANDTRFLWASQAKAQCGVAIGFFKSGTSDPVSIGKCDAAWQRLMAPPPVVMAPAPPPPSNPACAEPVAGIVFFDFDVAVPPPSASPTLDAVAQNASACQWRGLVVTGHTDRAGSDAYNDALSIRRANAVADLLASRGLGRGMLEVSGQGETNPRVPTVDGERNPQNRRVEITVK
jgi:OmpA-OmpF porin, OOP family